MLQGKLIGMVLSKILPLVMKEVIPLIKPLQKYVFTPNELDEEMAEVKRRLLVLEVKSHEHNEEE